MTRSAGLALCVLAVGCTAVVDLPSLEPEESLDACSNGRDDDLDGEMDCADAACARFCFDGDARIRPIYEPCFAAPELGLAFRAVDSDPVRCEPTPDRDLPCGDADHRPPGAASCRLVGVCAEGDWGSLPMEATTSGNRIHVRQGASGDGSEGTPFGSLAEALADAGEGDAILLAPGRYEIDRLARDVHVVGACPSLVRLELGSLEDGAELWNVTAAAPSGEALRLGAGAALRGVLVEGALEVLEAAQATLEDVHLESTDDVAIRVAPQASVAISASTIEATGTGVLSEGVLTLRGVSIRGTTVESVTIAAASPGGSTLAGVELEVTSGFGLTAECAGPTRCVELDHVVVRPPAVAAGDLLVGLALRSSGVVRKTRVERARNVSVELTGAREALVEDSMFTNGADVGVRVSGSNVVMRRIVLRDHTSSELAIDRTSSVTVAHLEARGIDPGTSASCLVVEGDLSMVNFDVSNCSVCGIELRRETITLSDGIVSDARHGFCYPRDADIDFEGLTRSVTFRDNASNFRRD